MNPSRLNAVGVVAIWFLLSSCSLNPSETDGRTILENRIARQAENRIKLVRFQKQNSKEFELVKGMKFHEMEYSAEIEFLEDCYWGSFNFLGQWEGSFHTVAGSSRGALDSMSPKFLGKRPAQKGTRVTVSGTFTFEKTEKGWRGPDGALLGSGLQQTAVSLPSESRAVPATSQPAVAGSRPDPVPAAPSKANVAVVPKASQVETACSPRPSPNTVLITKGVTDTFVGTAYHKDGAPTATSISFGGWGDAYYPHIKFALDDLPKDKKITSALLCLFAGGAPEVDPRLEIHRITQNWDQVTLSINNMPGRSPYREFGRIVEGWNSVDISELARDWEASPAANYGLTLVPNVTDRSNGAFTASEDRSGDRSPRLVLTLSPR